MPSPVVGETGTQRAPRRRRTPGRLWVVGGCGPLLAVAGAAARHYLPYLERAFLRWVQKGFSAAFEPVAEGMIPVEFGADAFQRKENGLSLVRIVPEILGR